jgi:hypothetical protein
MSSADTYKGDSPSKKFVRINHWMDTAYAFDDASGGVHLYLASRDAADYRVTRRLKLLAVGSETNQEAYALARAKHPEAELFLGNVVDCARLNKARPIRSALLDFCAQLSNELVATVIGVAAQIQPGGWVSVVFLKGRESDSSSGPSGAGRHFRRRAAAQLAKLKVDDTRRARLEAIHAKSMREVVLTGSHDHRITRAQALAEALNSRGVFVTPKAIWTYQSATNDSKGVPMMYVRFERISYEAFVSKSPKNTVFNTDIVESNKKIAANDDWVRKAALSAPGDSDTAADLLNLDPGTVAAWRAHATRQMKKEQTRT